MPDTYKIAQDICRYSCVTTALRAIYQEGTPGIAQDALALLRAMSTGIDIAIANVNAALARVEAAKMWVDTQLTGVRLAYDAFRDRLNREVIDRIALPPEDYLISCPQLALLANIMRGVTDDLLAPAEALFDKVERLLSLGMLYAVTAGNLRQSLLLLEEIKVCMRLFFGELDGADV